MESSDGSSNVRELRPCRCQGNGRTWADTSFCEIHDDTTSPLALAVAATYEEARQRALEDSVQRYERALVWIAEYGTREGDRLDHREDAMRAIARNALRLPVLDALGEEFRKAAERETAAVRSIPCAECPGDGHTCAAFGCALEDLAAHMHAPLARPVPWHYRFGPTNWLMAGPCPLRNGWRYRTIYRQTRRGAVNPFNGRVLSPPQGRLRSLWLTLTFPHIHHESEYEETDRG